MNQAFDVNYRDFEQSFEKLLFEERQDFALQKTETEEVHP